MLSVVLEVTGSKLHAKEKLSFGAVKGRKFKLTDTQTSTGKTAVNVEGKASITGSGAEVVQEDGNISFKV